MPAAHGMVGNVWFDRELDRLAYNIEDSRYHLLTAGADVDQKTEIDPTQKAAKVDGRSPAAILSSTFSDELAVHYDGKSKIFAVSVKDRGAVSWPVTPARRSGFPSPAASSSPAPITTISTRTG